MSNKKIVCLGGGTFFDVRPHLALAAPAFGTITKQIGDALHIEKYSKRNPALENFDIQYGFTEMCGYDFDYERDQTSIGRTNLEVDAWIQKNVIENNDVKIVFLSVAFCDFEGNIKGVHGLNTWSGKDQPRLKTSEGSKMMTLTPSQKVIGKIRKDRKDIFLVGFKTTAGADEDEMFESGLSLLKKNSCNLVVVNDTQTRTNMIVTPELTTYCVTKDRNQLVKELVEITVARASNKFTRTTIKDGIFLPWHSLGIPDVLQNVVDWCVENGAYEAFNNVTVGHFGFKPDPKMQSLYSSRRKKNFNNVADRDLVLVDFQKDEQIAWGAKPSAGARSQYIVLSKFDDLNCIVHFHCPLKPTSKIPQVGAQRPQKLFECGSHQCGLNTADGMVRVNKNLAVVMLDKHGPNIVFSASARPEMVIDFIRENFDLTKRTR